MSLWEGDLFEVFSKGGAEAGPVDFAEVSERARAYADAPKPPLRPNGQPRAEGTRLGNERGEGVSRD